MEYDKAETIIAYAMLIVPLILAPRMLIENYLDFLQNTLLESLDVFMCEMGITVSTRWSPVPR